MQLPEAAIGAVIAATITGLVSLLSLILSKEHKTSEFRQAWVDALREEISDHIAFFISIRGHISSAGGLTTEVWEKVHPDFLSLNQANAKIKLRLNPNEDACKRILAVMKKFEATYSNGFVASEDQVNTLIDELISEAQLLLKNEWKRVRNGELVFQIARGISFGVLLAGLIVIMFEFLVF